MYKIKGEKMQSIVEKLRMIRKLADEAIASLEYVVSSQGELQAVNSEYNPDDYLEKLMSYTGRNGKFTVKDESEAG